MRNRSANTSVNYQELAALFKPQDLVVPYGHGKDLAGRVLAVWPAIGMVDVAFFSGTQRYPVEDLQLFTEEGMPNPPTVGEVPGGTGTVSVSGGPAPKAARVAQAFVKQALYWAARDRMYRATAGEMATGQFKCPKCRQTGVDSILKKATFRHKDGQSERLFGCPACMFLIERDCIIGGEG